MGMCQFTEGYKDFPICNHVLDIGPENIGYQTGIFDDGLPFEVKNPKQDSQLLMALKESEDILNDKVDAKKFHNMNELLNDLKD